MPSVSSSRAPRPPRRRKRSRRRRRRRRRRWTAASYKDSPGRGGRRIVIRDPLDDRGVVRCVTAQSIDGRQYQLVAIVGDGSNRISRAEAVQRATHIDVSAKWKPIYGWVVRDPRFAALNSRPYPPAFYA